VIRDELQRIEEVWFCAAPIRAWIAQYLQEMEA
jgi:hypothetical protein